MIKKTAFLAAFLLVFTVLSFAQIRSYVPIVRPVLSKETKSFFTLLGSSMKRIGYDELADYFKAFSEGGYGSGFVYVASDKSNYVITNYHVIVGAESVKLEFEKEDGTMKTYENCPVVAWDDVIDLALVAFPAGEKPFPSGLNLSSTTLEDGMDVWTAGYPGLGKDPMWQLGKGNITNSRARIADLIDPAITALIQHSAQVDAGNSGGPLLVSDRTRTDGYDVIGINTWKVAGRQATNYSIPAPIILNFIETSRRQSGLKSEETKEMLEARSQEFITELGSEEIKLQKLIDYISYNCVIETGRTAMNAVMTDAPKRVREEILTGLSGFSPFVGIRMAIAYYFSMKSSIDKRTVPRFSFIAVDWESRDSLGNIVVRFLVNEKEISAVWRFEDGKWKLVDFPKADIEENSENKDENDNGMGIDTLHDYSILCGGTILDFDHVSEPYWVIGLDPLINHFFALGLHAGVRFGTYLDYWGNEKQAFYLLMELPLRIQLPVKIGKFCVIPYVAVCPGFEINFSTGPVDRPIIASGGIQFAYGKDPTYMIGCEYRFGLFSFSGSSTDFSQLFIYIGIGG